MQINTPELVLFDLYVTLVDSAPDLAWSVNQTLHQFALPQDALF